MSKLHFKCHLFDPYFPRVSNYIFRFYILKCFFYTTNQSIIYKIFTYSITQIVIQQIHCRKHRLTVTVAIDKTKVKFKNL